MDAFGSIAHFPVRHYLAATAIQAKGLDQLVNDPGRALRRLGELSVQDQAAAADAARAQQTALTADRALSARLMRQTLDALRGADAGAAARSGAGAGVEAEADLRADRMRAENAAADVSPEATPEATLAKARVVIAAAFAPAGPAAPAGAAGAKDGPSAEGLAAEEGAASDVAQFLAHDDRDSPYGVLSAA